MYGAEPSYVYIVSWKTSPEVVKIGRSNNPSKRFNDFLTAHHEELIVRCICDEDIITEANLHERHRSSQITLEHFQYTDDLKAVVEMLNASTGFNEYTIPRTLSQTGVLEPSPLIDQLRSTMSVPPLRISPREKDVAMMHALGVTVAETADILEISESAVKSHRSGVLQKTFAPNHCSALIKLIVHDIITKEDLT